MARIKTLGLTVLAWASLMASAGQAKLTGEFARFQQCPYNDHEVDSLLEATVTGRVGKDRRGLENPFLGLTCYAGSIVQAARRMVTLDDPSQLGTESTTTGTHASRTLTFSPA